MRGSEDHDDLLGGWMTELSLQYARGATAYSIEWTRTQRNQSLRVPAPAKTSRFLFVLRFRRRKLPTELIRMRAVMPAVVTELVEEPDPRGPFGAKEVGQGPLLPIMPAVANAVYDAVGVRIDEVPITPEKIMKALAEKRAGRDPRYGPTHFPDIDWPEALRVPPPWEGGDGNAVNDVPRHSKPRPEKEKVLSS